MSESGDFWRAYKDQKRAARRHYHECPTCAERYGTGTKVEPGHRCRNCGWEAPRESALTGRRWKDWTEPGL